MAAELIQRQAAELATRAELIERQAADLATKDAESAALREELAQYTPQYTQRVGTIELVIQTVGGTDFEAGALRQAAIDGAAGRRARSWRSAAGTTRASGGGIRRVTSRLSAPRGVVSLRRQRHESTQTTSHRAHRLSATRS